MFSKSDGENGSRLLKQLRRINIMLALLALIAVGAVLKLAHSVLMPLILAWLLAQLLGPPVAAMTRRKIPHGLAITIVLVLLLFVMYWAGVFISTSTASFLEELPLYKEKFAAMITGIGDRITGNFSTISNADLNRQLETWLTDFFGTLMGVVGGLLSVLTSFVSRMVIIIIILAFMLVGKPHIQGKFQRAFSERVAGQVSDVVQSINTQISRYLILQCVMSLVTGVMVWAVCTLVGVGSAVTWGALAFFLNFIPTIGSIMAALPPVLLALLQFYPSFWPAVIVAGSILLINQVIGNVVSPKLMGDTLNLSPVVILISLLFWGWLWGIMGALLSVLIAASLKIICDNIEELRPVGVMMEAGKFSRKSG